MKSLIPDKINAGLNEIVGKCFEGNRIADRGMSILSVKFAMNKTEKILHEKLAHLFPLLADEVSSYQGDRDNLTIYAETFKDDTDYNSPTDFFERMLGYMNELETLVSEVSENAFEEDPTTYTFLCQFLLRIVKVTAQCLLLVDKAEMYNKDWMSFDHNIEDFVIL